MKTKTYDCARLPQFDLVRESEEIRRTGALYLLQMKAIAIDSVVENTTNIVKTSIKMIKSGLMNRLDTAGKDFSAVPGLLELFQEDSLALNPFSGLTDEQQQNKYFKEKLNLVVSISG